MGSIPTGPTANPRSSATLFGLCNPSVGVGLGPTWGPRVASSRPVGADGVDAEVAIEFRGVSKTYPGAAKPALQTLDLSVGAGELLVLLGPSGCGKTTTLRLVNRLEEPTTGSIWINGTDSRALPVEQLRRGIGYVVQESGLFPHRSVRSNIATVPNLLKWPKDRINARVEELATLLALDPALLDRYPASLSGGQRQRVGVARALAAGPPILLMDEPYSAVDPVVRHRLQGDLLSIHDRLRTTIVLVTHDVEEALRLADRVVLFNDTGHVAQVGTTRELLQAPANDFVVTFVGAQRALRSLALVALAEVVAVRGRPVAAEHVDHAGSAMSPADGVLPPPPLPLLSPDTDVRAAIDAMISAGCDRVLVAGDPVMSLTFGDLATVARGNQVEGIG